MIPIVAVTAGTAKIGRLPRVRVNEAYTDAVKRFGAVPLVVPPLGENAADAVLDRVDGLLVTGGEDVDPALYGQSRHPTVDEVHAARDRSEIALVRAARSKAVPTLAICRGVQVANVALGGTLVQDVRSLIPGAHAHDCGDEGRAARVHPATIAPGSRLGSALGATALLVNSIHHQALDRAAEGLDIVARADDGVIEGVEWRSDAWWMIGVQWHPEELVDSPEPWDRALLTAFIEACATQRAAR